MKLYTFLIAFTVLLITTAVSCDRCKQDNITRPDLTADELKWVMVNDTTPFFKITTFYTNGDTVIDTIQGKYSFEIQERQNDVDDCYWLYYKKYYNNFSLTYKNSGYGANFIMDNYSEDGFKGSFGGNAPFLTKTSSLDTVTVNGKFYNEVFMILVPSTYIFYYAKGVGFIYIHDEEFYVAEKQRTVIERIH